MILKKSDFLQYLVSLDINQHHNFLPYDQMEVLFEI